MSDDVAARRVDIGADHPAFDGHFPGRPVLPGVALLALVLEAALADRALAERIGPTPRLSVVKFLAPVGPQSSLAIAFRVGPSAIDWRVDEGDRAVASGRIAALDSAAASAA